METSADIIHGGMFDVEKTASGGLDEYKTDLLASALETLWNREPYYFPIFIDNDLRFEQTNYDPRKRRLIYVSFPLYSTYFPGNSVLYISGCLESKFIRITNYISKQGCSLALLDSYQAQLEIEGSMSYTSYLEEWKKRIDSPGHIICWDLIGKEEIIKNGLLKYCKCIYETLNYTEIDFQGRKVFDPSLEALTIYINNYGNDYQRNPKETTQVGNIFIK